LNPAESLSFESFCRCDLAANRRRRRTRLALLIRDLAHDPPAILDLAPTTLAVVAAAMISHFSLERQ
jgi:hypothetical protein